MNKSEIYRCGLRLIVVSSLAASGLVASGSARASDNAESGGSPAPKSVEYVPGLNDDIRFTFEYPTGEVQILNCHAGTDDAWRQCLGWFQDSESPAFNSALTSDDEFALGTLDDGTRVSAEIRRSGKSIGVLVCKDGKIVPADLENCSLVLKAKPTKKGIRE